MKERDKDILEHIVKYCNDIAEIIAEYDDTLETLRAKKAFRHSVSMCIFQIGELAKHLTTEFRNANSHIAWKKIIKMREIAAHHYEKFDIETVHDVIIDNIPELRGYCQKLLDNA